MRFLKFAVALFLLPTLAFTLLETGRILVTVLGNFRQAIGFLLGASVYAGIHFGIYNFSRPYVFIHEMTHALAALLCGGRVRDIRIGKDSGYVKMDKANAFVVLAPYFVPGYVLATAFCYVVGDLFWNLLPYRQIFLFLIGFWMTFHFIQTFKTLFEADQPDLKLAGGKVFSTITIVLANLVVLAVVLKGLFPESVSLCDTAVGIAKATLNAWRILVNYIVEYLINTL